MDSTHSIFEQAINDARKLIETSQSDNYLIDFPYSTYTVPRPGEALNEPGRQNFRHTLNLNNLKIVEQFVKKHELDVTADPEKVFLPRLKECLISDFSQENFDIAENNHRQKWRLVDGIGAFINQTLTWAQELTDFVNNPNGTHRDHILELIKNIDTVVMSNDCEESQESLIQANIKKPVVLNVKSQDISTQVIKDGQTVLTMINASAGSEGSLEDGGGTFGDPVYSLTTQEEDLYRTFPFHIKFFVQFVLSRYVDATTKKEKVSRFVYLDKYAPKNGKCLVLENGKQFYLFSAANDNSKVQFTEEQQTLLFKKVFTVAYEVLIRKKINTFIPGAFGLGVFKGNAHCLAEAVDNVHNKYANPHSSHQCNIIFAYYIRNKTDSTAIANFNIMAEKFGSPSYLPF